MAPGGGLTPVQVLGGLAILAAAVILQRSTQPAERVVAAPAVEGDTDEDDADGASGVPMPAPQRRPEG